MAWIGQIASAVSYMHTQRTLHRDLSAANVFLSGLGEVKVNRHTCTHMLHIHTYIHTYIHTRKRLPPGPWPLSLLASPSLLTLPPPLLPFPHPCLLPLRTCAYTHARTHAHTRTRALAHMLAGG